jgi:hypothetical protein
MTDIQSALLVISQPQFAQESPCLEEELLMLGATKQPSNI